MRAWGVFRQLLAATLCALLVAPAYLSESILPRSSSTPNHTYDAETVPETRVWGSNEEILLHFRATLLLSEKQHWGYAKCSWKNVVGSVVTYDYDAFGNLIHSTGTTPNNYLFDGEQFDPDLNLYFNRARYLNTSTGRFWSMDTDEGNDGTPLSLHKYLYTSADPLNFKDPSGLERVDEILVGETEKELIQIRITVEVLQQAPAAVSLATRAFQVLSGIAILTTALLLEGDNSPNPGPAPPKDKNPDQEVFYRFGFKYEGADALETQSQQAQSVLGVHGVSVSTKATYPRAGPGGTLPARR